MKRFAERFMEILETEKKMVGARGFEPPTPDTPCQCATRLRYAPTSRNLRSKVKKRLTNWDPQILRLMSNIVNFLSKVQLPTGREPLCSTFPYSRAKGSFLFPFSGKDHKGKGEHDDTE